MKWLMIGFIKAWRLVISPLYGNVCRYYPSCSAYGLESVQVHGAMRGGMLTVRRIARCNPWSAGGYDPVPGTPAARDWEREQAEAASSRQDFARQQPDPPDAPGSPQASVDGATNTGLQTEPTGDRETGPGAPQTNHSTPKV